MVIKRFRLIGRREHRSVIIIVSGKKGIASGILLMGLLFDTQSRIVLKFALDRLVEFGRALSSNSLTKRSCCCERRIPMRCSIFRLCAIDVLKNGTAIGTVPILYRKWDSNPHSR